jgi:PadR family transcriptional regulator AphA
MATAALSPASRTSASKFALLGMLTLKPMSGYELRSLIAESIGYFWSESYGQIYPTLKQLKREKLIRKVKDPHVSGRERQTYAITDQGTEALREWLALPPYSPPARSELLLKVFFGPETDNSSIRQHVLDLRTEESLHLSQYAGVEESLRRNHPKHPGLPYWLMTLRFGQKRSQAMVEWCDETLHELGQLLRNARSNHSPRNLKNKKV